MKLQLSKKSKVLHNFLHAVQNRLMPVYSIQHEQMEQRIANVLVNEGNNWTEHLSL